MQRCLARLPGSPKSSLFVYLVYFLVANKDSRKLDQMVAVILQRNLVISLYLNNQKNAKKKKLLKKRIWVDVLWQRRREQGDYDNLVQEMRFKNHGAHFEHFALICGFK